MADASSEPFLLRFHWEEIDGWVVAKSFTETTIFLFAQIGHPRPLTRELGEAEK